MAYIAYKHPFNDDKGQITKWAKFFGWLMFISIIFSIYILVNTSISDSKKEKLQNGLHDTIKLTNKNIESLKKSIDSLGYKIDKSTGKIVPKVKPTIAKPTTVHDSIIYYKGVKQRHINDADIKLLTDSMPDKSRRVEIQRLPNKESENFTKEVISKLIKMGYTKVDTTSTYLWPGDKPVRLYVTNLSNIYIILVGYPDNTVE